MLTTNELLRNGRIEVLYHRGIHVFIGFELDYAFDYALDYAFFDYALFLHLDHANLNYELKANKLLPPSSASPP